MDYIDQEKLLKNRWTDGGASCMFKPILLDILLLIVSSFVRKHDML